MEEYASLLAIENVLGREASFSVSDAWDTIGAAVELQIEQDLESGGADVLEFADVYRAKRRRLLGPGGS